MPSSPKLSAYLGRELDTSSSSLPSLPRLLHDLRNRTSLSSTSVKFILLCLLWYLSSALSNNSAKQILITFSYPVTLTFIQFGFISGWCVLLAFIQQVRGESSRALFGANHGIRHPTLQIVMTTLPMSVFQIAGHIFGSLATSQIPVSVVHTVKALSPLFTVLTYRLMFNVQYSPSTYFSLLPLTLGVMLACSFELSANIFGLICALGSTVVFVSQNIFIKKLHFQESSATERIDGSIVHTSVQGVFKGPIEKEKLDKLNILFYSSGMAFLLMIPIWLYNEGGGIVWRYIFGSTATSNIPSASPTLLFIFNGTVHFGQNIIAFSLLSVASPVAYSIAGLVKRIFVIVLSIIWFGQRTTFIQACGIVMTFVGLYMYDRAKMEVARGERKVQRMEFKEKHLLPLDTSDLKLSTSTDPFSMNTLSATSATENRFREPPRRRSSSVTERPVMVQSNWNLGGIMEMTPPLTPRRTSPVLQPPPQRSENRGVVVPKSRQQKRRYSGSFHVLGQVNEFQKSVPSPRTEYPTEGIEEKASWE